MQNGGRPPGREVRLLDVYNERPVRVSAKVLVPVKEHPKVHSYIAHTKKHSSCQATKLTPRYYTAPRYAAHTKIHSSPKGHSSPQGTHFIPSYSAYPSYIAHSMNTTHPKVHSSPFTPSYITHLKVLSPSQATATVIKDTVHSLLQGTARAA